MKKILHERLREYEISDDWCISMRTAGYIADEIERYYIPRPRFDDGEPINLENAPDDVEYIAYYIDGSGYGLIRHDIDDDYEFKDIYEPLKRPQPKVYDADGVEINVGDTVWHVQGSNPLTVKGIKDGYVWVDESILAHNSCLLTHKEPDSLERIAQFAKDQAIYSECEASALHEVADRLTDIMERDE